MNDHILLQGTLTSSIPDMRKVNGLIDLSNKYQGDGSNNIDAKVNLYFEIQYPTSSSVRLAGISIESEKRDIGCPLTKASFNLQWELGTFARVRLIIAQMTSSKADFYRLFHLVQDIGF